MDARHIGPVLLALLAILASSSSAARPLPSSRPAGDLEAVATFDGPMPTGVTVSAQGRIFVNFPRWGDEVPFTVAEVVDGRAVAYPDAEINVLDRQNAADHFISVQSVVVGPEDRLWVLDTGRPGFAPTAPGGAKLVAIDLASGEVVQRIVFDRTVARPTTYLNDVRFDLRRGSAGHAFITDSSLSGDNGIIVVDLGSEKAWRRLDRHSSTLPDRGFVPIVEGRPLMNRPAGGTPSPMTVGADGIAINADGSRLFYRPLSGRGLFSVSTAALIDPERTEAEVEDTVVDHGALGFASDGLEHDDQGRLYLTNYEDDGILRRDAQGRLTTLVHDPRALWPDTMAVASDGYLYFTANQLHRQPGFHRGQDLREKPYVLFRIAIDAGPVRLGP